MTTKTTNAIYIRWMIRRDLPEVLAIENESYADPWGDDDFIRALRQRNCIGMIAAALDERGQELSICGYMVYELHRATLQLINMAVKPTARRRGVGRKMLAKLTDKLSTQRRNRLIIDVRETNLPMQLFLKASGFRATGVDFEAYTDQFGETEDSYRFEYRMEATA